MSRDLIFAPVLLQVLMTLGVYVLLIKRKIRSIRAGTVNVERRALYDDAWPADVIQINNNLRNQFELPVLFYALCGVLWALDAVSVVALVAAWLFVASRLVHVWIHCTSNYVPNRRRAFTVGWWILVAMTLLAGWELLR
ncbi:MAG: hypothetical protein HC809_17340 [Gammaproteobacteria bacterium]|nr:hypothetical protein [Gammaproteobacteria bacterium]